MTFDMQPEWMEYVHEKTNGNWETTWEVSLSKTPPGVLKELQEIDKEYLDVMHKPMFVFVE